MKKSYLMLVVSMLTFGTIGIFRKYIPLSSGMLAFVRGILGSLFLVAWVKLRRHKLSKPDRRTVFWLVITGALIGLNWIFLFEAYNLTTVANATMSYYMQPTIVILLSPIFFKEKLGLRKIVCAILAIIGMVFVSGIMDSKNENWGSMQGIWFGLIAAALYATVVIFNKKISISDAYTKTILQLFSAAMVLIPYLVVTESRNPLQLDWFAVVMVLIVGIFHTGVAYALYFGSMTQLKSQSIAVLSYIDPVFALVLSQVFLHERMTIYGGLGAVLIIGSALYSEMLAE